ncbi:MAG: hypothetical protein RDU20_08695 [Desulfomonilaceae bacterium]|nr:hypothetical protein [Desulfomonilaceae bacterium]
MSEKKKWDAEKVHQEVYDARTRMFVVLKVLETESLQLKEHPEWALLIRPLLNEIIEYAQSIRAMAEEGLESGAET